jgi:hypothetical protein
MSESVNRNGRVNEGTRKAVYAAALSRSSFVSRSGRPRREGNEGDRCAF